MKEHAIVWSYTRGSWAVRRLGLDDFGVKIETEKLPKNWELVKI